jgi:hypothetical protein
VTITGIDTSSVFLETLVPWVFGCFKRHSKNLLQFIFVFVVELNLLLSGE